MSEFDSSGVEVVLSAMRMDGRLYFKSTQSVKYGKRCGWTEIAFQIITKTLSMARDVNGRATVFQIITKTLSMARDADGRVTVFQINTKTLSMVRDANGRRLYFKSSLKR